VATRTIQWHGHWTSSTCWQLILRIAPANDGHMLNLFGLLITLWNRRQLSLGTCQLCLAACGPGTLLEPFAGFSLSHGKGTCQLFT